MMEDATEKLIFLDIDGVLRPYYRPYPTILSLDEDCLARFVKLVKEVEFHRHKVSVVISSTWRKIDSDMVYLDIILGRNGIDVVGKTPNSSSRNRGEEILDYLKVNPCPRKDWIVIEDEFPGMEPVVDRWVFPYLYDGLQDNDVPLGLKLLLGK